MAFFLGYILDASLFYSASLGNHWSRDALLWQWCALYPKSVTCLLKFVIAYCFLMPSGTLYSTIDKGSLYLYCNNLLGGMILYNVWRNLGSLVIINRNISK